MTALEADSALLAGLTHSIGLAPILVRAESEPALLNDAHQLERLVYELHPVIGARILEQWGFSEALVRVPAEHLDLGRDGTDGGADYVDVVQVALIQTLDDASHPLAGAEPTSVMAFDPLGMRDSLEEITLAGGVIEVEEIRAAIL